MHSFQCRVSLKIYDYLNAAILKELLNVLLQFITDSRNRFTQRMSVVIIVLAGVVLTDNTFGFSYHYRMNAKIEELAKVNSIIQNPLSDSLTKTLALSWRQDMLTRKSWYDYFLSFKASISLKNPQTNNAAHMPTGKESINDILMFISCVGGFIVLFFLLVLLDIFYESSEIPMSVKIATLIVYTLIISILGSIVILICKRIPIIHHNWTNNYILNALVQCIVIVLFLLCLIYYHRRRMKRNMELLKELKRDYKVTQTYPPTFYT